MPIICSKVALLTGENYFWVICTFMQRNIYIYIHFLTLTAGEFRSMSACHVINIYWCLVLKVEGQREHTFIIPSIQKLVWVQRLLDVEYFLSRFLQWYIPKRNFCCLSQSNIDNDFFLLPLFTNKCCQKKW